MYGLRGLDGRLYGLGATDTYQKLLDLAKTDARFTGSGDSTMGPLPLWNVYLAQAVGANVLPNLGVAFPGVVLETPMSARTFWATASGYVTPLATEQALARQAAIVQQQVGQQAPIPPIPQPVTQQAIQQPVTQQAVQTGGFSLSSIPWWGWAAGAGVAFFAFSGKRR